MRRLGVPRGSYGAALFGAVLIVLALAAAPAQAARPLATGFADGVWFDSGGAQWISRTAATGATRAMLTITWAQVEPTAPAPGTDPTNPAGSQFNFGYIDSVLREFANTDVAPVLMVTSAPRWAEKPGGPAALEAEGAWEPNATALGQFAMALAKRYGGSYPDPLNPGHTLPRVRYFQDWAEANFTVNLAPQWTKSGKGWAPAAPEMYRSMLNAFYAGVKAVHSDNVVLTTGFGPYGDQAGSCSNDLYGPGCRTPPAMFARELMCLQGQALKRESCPDPPHFDVLATDPYEVAGPTTHAVNADDVSAPDLGKLTRILNKATSTGLALPAGHKQLWVTEFGYDSNPPNPTAVSLATQARWLEQAFYVFWSEGVSTAVWYLVRDQAPTYHSQDYYSGVYYYDGTAKPSLEAFRFPFVVVSAGRAAKAWGISPRAGTLAVEHQHGHSWKTLFKVRVSAAGTFVRNVSSRLRGNFRAVVGGESSLVWTR
jgi:hypothetical protein